jgi:hypothetical protein
MKTGRKQTRITFTPFARREREESYSTTVIRISRCNLCGAIRVWPYEEVVLRGTEVAERVQHPGHPVEHEPGCPLAQTPQLPQQ